MPADLTLTEPVSQASGRRFPFPWVWLAAAAAFWVFTGGRFIIPAAAWFAPAFMLAWFRGQKRPWLAYTGALAAAAAATYVSWGGIATVMMPREFFVVFCLAAAAVYLLPYLADRLLSFRLKGFAQTLFFPAAAATLEYVLALISPLGTWNALGYTQYGDLPLMQLGALTGVYGLTFVLAWFAAVLNWLWEERAAWPRVRTGVTIYAGVLAAVFLAGGLRLTLAPRPADTVRVAGIVPRPFFLSARPELGPKLLAGERFDAATTATLKKETAAINDDLLERSRREARAGAKIIVWGEAAAQLLREDEPALLARGRAFAAEERVWLAMGVATLAPGEQKPVRNKLVLVDPAGSVVWDYVKSKPVPGPEDIMSVRGDGVLPLRGSGFGVLGGAICYDMDFPAMVRQLGRYGADVVLVPSHDWREMGDLHSRLAAFRGVEFGFSVFRPDGEGVSLASDYLGRPLATVDHHTRDDDGVVVAYLPSRGVITPYALVGDLFAWLCCGAFVFLAAWSRLRRRSAPPEA